MYFYLPGDVSKYYRLAKRPKFYYLSFEVPGVVVKAEKKHFSSNFNPNWLDDFLIEANKYLGQTKGMLIPIHLAPPHVTTRADFKSLPTISRPEQKR